MFLVLFHSPNAVQMGEANFPDFFVQVLHISILNHHAHFTRFHNTRARQKRRRDRGGDGERERERQEGETDREEREGVVCQRESLSPLQQELSAGAVRVAINKKCFLP